MGIFKKIDEILKQIVNLKQEINDEYKYRAEDYKDIKDQIQYVGGKVINTERAIKTLDDKIEKVENIFTTFAFRCAENDSNAEIFFYKPYRGEVILYQDGKKIDTTMVKEIYIHSECGARTSVEVNR